MKYITTTIIFGYMLFASISHGQLSKMDQKVACKSGTSLETCLKKIETLEKVKIICPPCSNIFIDSDFFLDDFQSSLSSLMEKCRIANYIVNYDKERKVAEILINSTSKENEPAISSVPVDPPIFQTDKNGGYQSIMNLEDPDLEVLPPATPGAKGITSRQLLQIESQMKMEKIDPDEVILPSTSSGNKGITQRELEIILEQSEENKTLGPDEECLPAANPGEKGLTVKELNERLNQVKEFAPPDEVIPPTEGKKGVTLKEIEAAIRKNNIPVGTFEK